MLNGKMDRRRGSMQLSSPGNGSSPKRGSVPTGLGRSVAMETLGSPAAAEIAGGTILANPQGMAISISSSSTTGRVKKQDPRATSGG